MQPRGFKTATVKRTLIEAFCPFILLYLILIIWNIDTLNELAIVYVLTFIPELWMSMWPAYRLRSGGRGLDGARKWLNFLLPYLGMVIVTEWIMEQLLARSSIYRQYSELLYQHQEPLEDILFVLFLAFAMFLTFRLLFLLLNRLWQWASNRLVRQMTLSHISLFLFLVILLICVVLFYILSFFIPQVVRGEQETEKMAAMAAPMMSSTRLIAQLPEWIKHVPETAWDQVIFKYTTYKLERHWRIYDRQGRLLASNCHHKPSKEPAVPPVSDEEKQFVKQIVRKGKMDSIPIKSGSIHMTGAPVRGDKGTIVGVVCQIIKFDDFFYVDTVVLVMSLFLLLSIPLILLTIGVAFLLALPFAYLRAKPLTLRIGEVALAAHAWSTGKLSARIKDQQQDELGVLSQQLNQVAASLEETTNHLAKEKRQVENLLMGKREFVADVSHELRNPIAILLGYLELLDQQPEGDEPVDIALLKRETIRLKQLIDELFSAAIQDDKQSLESTLEIETCEIPPLLKQLHAGFSRIAWQKKKIAMELDLGPNLPPIQADAKILEQILQNLLRNALRHTPEGAMIMLTCQTNGSELTIEVIDTGSGIPQEDLPYIFERYYRGKSGRHSQGAGLGLALVKNMVEAMGGRVKAESRVGEGTVIRLIFPLKPAIDEDVNTQAPIQ
ncbi:signal transduction histidine kinase [Laceyella sediminis]|uniref:histidine kinase n=1 Tax=Laceyella sediminis TaxID=573074 RepID=A0ABX5EJL7_9BACL|nr:HAMP domain-containing sensor histidine kinase [Laceyella sediminis]PRZ11898.1 signal transduction histidine kinase [Laceyella sediminis]